MAFVCPWTMLELERSQKQESNWHFVYRLKIAKTEEKTRTRKTSSSAVFSRSSSTKRSVAIAAAAAVIVSRSFSFVCLFSSFSRKKTKEMQRIITQFQHRHITSKISSFRSASLASLRPGVLYYSFLFSILFDLFIILALLK